MKYYAVIDTNVVVSSMLCKTSYPGRIIEMINNDIIKPLYCQEIINEYKEVLIRNKFGFDEKQISNLIKTFVEKGKDYERTKTDEKFADEDDAVFYEIVMTGNRERSCWLVTGNKRHYPIKTFVVSPHEMVEIIESK